MAIETYLQRMIIREGARRAYFLDPLDKKNPYPEGSDEAAEWETGCDTALTAEPWRNYPEG